MPNKAQEVLFGAKCGPRKPCSECNRAGAYVHIYAGTSEGCMMKCSCNEMYGTMPLDIITLWLKTCKTPKEFRD